MSLLFDNSKNRQYLGVFFNNEPYSGSVYELFDAEKFDEIFICTYVSSVKHFFDKTAQFDRVELLLGIEETLNAQKFAFDPTAQNEFFKSLDQDTLQKIADNKISVRFTSIGTTIHSKIYLLKNSKTGKKRAIVGSANFSKTAFEDNGQYEELVSFDGDINSAFVDYYFQRYDKIKDGTVDFVPDYLKKKIKKENLAILNLTEEESIKLLKDNIKNIQAAIVVPDRLSKAIDTTKAVLSTQSDELKKEIESIAKTKTLIEIVTKNTKGKAAFVSPVQIEHKKEQIVTKALKPNIVKKEFEDLRNRVYYSQKLQTIVKMDEQSGQLITYPKQCSAECIKEKIELLDKFIKSYTIFTINEEGETQKRIFEAILYAFCSVYIWRLRKEAVLQQAREEAKTNIPIFMLIAGMAQSGKTHLLKFISQIMGNNGHYYHYIKQARLMSNDQINPQVIFNFFNEENLTHIFVDEINKEYFSSTSSATSSYMGEAFIKNITNSKEGIYPAMIATSNTDFSANAQVMRRIYYIQLNNPFDNNKKTEAAEYFNSVLFSFGDELFRDFLFRFEKRFKEGVKVDSDDVLSIGRDIFEEYFSILGIELPQWFSKERIDDYYIRGRNIWRNLYTLRRDGFMENEKENMILLDDEVVFGSKLSANKEKREQLQYLPIGVVIEDKGIVKLNREKFFDFIQVKPKSKGFIFRLFSKK
jgi:hypothetical protein